MVPSHPGKDTTVERPKRSDAPLVFPQPIFRLADEKSLHLMLTPLDSPGTKFGKIYPEVYPRCREEGN